MTAKPCTAYGPDHDMHGDTPVVEGTRLVPLARARALGGPAAAGAALAARRAATRAGAEIDLELSRGHSYFADIYLKHTTSKPARDDSTHSNRKFFEGEGTESRDRPNVGARAEVGARVGFETTSRGQVARSARAMARGRAIVRATRGG